MRVNSSPAMSSIPRAFSVAGTRIRESKLNWGAESFNAFCPGVIASSRAAFSLVISSADIESEEEYEIEPGAVEEQATIKSALSVAPEIKATRLALAVMFMCFLPKRTFKFTLLKPCSIVPCSNSKAKRPDFSLTASHSSFHCSHRKLSTVKLLTMKTTFNLLETTPCSDSSQLINQLRGKPPKCQY